MSYGAYISFKKMSTDDIYPFFQQMKTQALAKLKDIAEIDFRYCPLTKFHVLSPDDKYEEFIRVHREDFLESEAWFTRIFSYRWFYDTKWKMLGVYGIPSALRDLFDGTVYFQNYTDQNYDREDYDGIETFEIIYDQWLAGKSDKFIRKKLRKEHADPDFTATPEELKYNRQTFAYKEIWNRIEHTLYDDDTAVHISLFADASSIIHRAKFMALCFNFAKQESLDIN